MRTLVDIPDDILMQLDAIARQRRASRAALVREALAAWLADNPASSPADAAGLWGDGAVDGLAFQAEARRRW